MCIELIKRPSLEAFCETLSNELYSRHKEKSEPGELLTRHHFLAKPRQQQEISPPALRSQNNDDEPDVPTDRCCVIS